MTLVFALEAALTLVFALEAAFSKRSQVQCNVLFRAIIDTGKKNYLKQRFQSFREKNVFMQ